MSNITTVAITPLHLNSVGIRFDCADLSVKQTVTPEWSAEPGYGKMDPIATYGRTGRTAQISMITIAQNAADAIRMQATVEYLYQMNYPVFGPGQTLAAPPFFAVEVLQSRMFRTIKGYFTEVSIEPGSDQEIVPLVSNGKFYERRYDISLSMTVMHSTVPGHNGAGAFNSDGGFVYVTDASNRPSRSNLSPHFGVFEADFADPNEVTTVSALQDTVGLNEGSSVESLKDNLTKKSGGSTVATKTTKDTSD